MSLFKVEKTKISKIYVHPNADRLSLANVEDKTWQFVIKKDEFKVGDEVVFFPVDSLIPKDLSDHFGITSFLGSGGRLKTIRLRQEWSQGFVSPINLVKEFLIKIQKEFNEETLTEDLGIVKWEITMPLIKNHLLKPLPPFVSVFDIEGCDNFPRIVEMLMDEKIFITEKCEGQNWGVAIDENDKITVFQRKFSVEKKESIEGEEEQENTLIKIAKEGGFIDFIKSLKEKEFPNCVIAIRGEALGGGIQKNIYNLYNHTARLFDIQVNQKYLEAKIFIDILKKYNMFDKCVPILCQGEKTLREWLAGKTIREASDGKSVLLSQINREGIVLKPWEKEQYIDRFGRLMLKQRSPIYLEKTGN